jgi:hypothetical protein
MFKVECGIKLDYWEQGQVFGSKLDFLTIKEAKTEVNNMLNTIIKKLFKKVKHNKLFETPKDYKAWYPENPNKFLVVRMDGTVDDGEFYIAIYEIHTKC